MGTDKTEEKDLNALSRRVIGCAFRVGNGLGAGFLEKVYENALAHELRKEGVNVEQQGRLEVWYDGVQVGEYIADLIVAESILIEIKAVRALDSSHEAQAINYPAATRLPICLLLNFSPRVEVRRVVGPSFPSPRYTRPNDSDPPIPMTWSERSTMDPSSR